MSEEINRFDSFIQSSIWQDISNMFPNIDPIYLMYISKACNYNIDVICIQLIESTDTTTIPKDFTAFLATTATGKLYLSPAEIAQLSVPTIPNEPLIQREPSAKRPPSTPATTGPTLSKPASIQSIFDLRRALPGHITAALLKRYYQRYGQDLSKTIILFTKWLEVDPDGSNPSLISDLYRSLRESNAPPASRSSAPVPKEQLSRFEAATSPQAINTSAYNITPEIIPATNRVRQGSNNTMSSFDPFEGIIQQEEQPADREELILSDSVASEDNRDHNDNDDDDDRDSQQFVQMPSRKSQSNRQMSTIDQLKLITNYSPRDGFMTRQQIALFGQELDGLDDETFLLIESILLPLLVSKQKMREYLRAPPHHENNPWKHLHVRFDETLLRIDLEILRNYITELKTKLKNYQTRRVGQSSTQSMLTRQHQSELTQSIEFCSGWLHLASFWTLHNKEKPIITTFRIDLHQQSVHSATLFCRFFFRWFQLRCDFIEAFNRIRWTHRVDDYQTIREEGRKSGGLGSSVYSSKYDGLPYYETPPANSYQVPDPFYSTASVYFASPSVACSFPQTYPPPSSTNRKFGMSRTTMSIVTGRGVHSSDMQAILPKVVKGVHGDFQDWQIASGNAGGCFEFFYHGDFA